MRDAPITMCGHWTIHHNVRRVDYVRRHTDQVPHRLLHNTILQFLNALFSYLQTYFFNKNAQNLSGEYILNLSIIIIKFKIHTTKKK